MQTYTTADSHEREFKQCAHTMNTVRSCFAAAFAYLAVVIGWWAADAVVCCNSSSVASGGGGIDRSCWNKNQTFHMIETVDGGTCDDNRKAMPVRKCCPPDQPYDPEVQFCGPAGADGDEYHWKMMQRLRDEFTEVADALMVGYIYEQPKCDDKQVLVDLPAVEVHGLMGVNPSAPGYCFDVTPSDELVARTCRKRNQNCGLGKYTNAKRCCYRNQIDPYCMQTEKDFIMSAYETDADGCPIGRSNSRVNEYVRIRCFNYQLKVTVNRTMYVNREEYLSPDVIYCEDSSTVYNYIAAMVCPDDRRNVLHFRSESLLSFFDHFQCYNKKILKEGFILTTNFVLHLIESEYAKHPPNQKVFLCDKYTDGSISIKKYFFILAGYLTSVVFLALTLFVYATLPSLRNVHGYYVMCYLACLLMLYILKAIDMMAFDDMMAIDDIHIPLKIIFGYFTVFAYLTIFCWLNVICFDIYWKMRYNNSINRNKSTSVRTIMYHIYCWGFPSSCISTGHLYALHLIHEKERILEETQQFTHSCWFFDCTTTGNFIFIIMFVSMMLSANLMLFLLTAIHCSRIKSELNKFNPTDSKTKSFQVNKEKFVMNIKLFLIMGIPWSSEVISIFFQDKWSILEFCNAIIRQQGVFVFIVLVAKRNVIMELRKHFKRSMDHRESTQLNNISGSS